jgi:hypothetical protein
LPDTALSTFFVAIVGPTVFDHHPSIPPVGNSTTVWPSGAINAQATSKEQSLPIAAHSEACLHRPAVYRFESLSPSHEYCPVFSTTYNAG